jgi:hypothetical protein
MWQRRAKKHAENRIDGILFLWLARGDGVAVARKDVADTVLLKVSEEGRQMPHANKRRSAIAMRSARPDQ